MPSPRSPHRSTALLLLAVVLFVASLGLGVGRAGAAAPVPVPSSIDSTGRADVTGALNSFLASVPDGSTVVFASGGRYRIEGSLLLENRRNLTIDGRGSTFFATTEGDRSRAQWKVQLSSGITLRAMIVIGANENSGVNGVFDVDREAQHAFSIQGSDHVTLDNVEAHDTYGDFVYIDKHAGTPATFITVQGSRFSGSGRQGISVSSGEDVVITGNSIGDVRRSLFDFEPYSDRISIRRIHVVNNSIGSARFYFVASGGHAAVVEDIEIRGNRLTDMLPSVVIEGQAGMPRRRITVADNTTNVGSNRPVFSFTWVDGATVTGNTVPFAAEKDGYIPTAVKSRSSCRVVVQRNNFNGANLLDTDSYPCPGPSPPATIPPVPGAGTGGDAGDGGSGSPTGGAVERGELSVPSRTAAARGSQAPGAGATGPAATQASAAPPTVAGRASDSTARVSDDVPPVRAVPVLVAALLLVLTWTAAFRVHAARRVAVSARGATPPLELDEVEIFVDRMGDVGDGVDGRAEP